jgi:threonine dehydratase
VFLATFRHGPYVRAVSAPAPAARQAVSLASIQQAQTELRGVVTPTPMVQVGGAGLPWPAGPTLHLKCEQLQPIGAFKVRGAFTAIARLDAATRARGIVTSSSGNHGQAVAFVARRFGVRSVVVMPESAAAVKVAGVRQWGGEVVFAGAVRSPEQQRVAERFAADEGLTMIPPFDHPDVIAGQGTAGLEILAQVEGVQTVLVPVGGGGLLAGITAVIAATRPDIEIVGVEPAGAPKLSAALAAGRPAPLEQTASLADGLLTRAIGTLPWAIIAGRVRRAITVSEEEIRGAVAHLFHRQGLRVEPSGAVTMAALLAGRIRPPGPTVAVLSGGNVDLDLFQQLVAG